MKKLIFLITTIIASQAVSGQSKDFYLGPSISMQGEKKDFKFNSLTKSISGYSEVGSVLIFGIGIRIHKYIHKSWSLNVGINYMRREVWFNSPIWAPDLKSRYSETDHFGYNTIEILTGINKQLYKHKRWQIYSGLNFIMNSVIKSDKINNGKSLNPVCGIGYNLNDGIKFIAEPTIRIVHREKYSDPFMYEWSSTKYTFFNNLGVNLLLMYRIK